MDDKVILFHQNSNMTQNIFWLTVCWTYLD